MAILEIVTSPNNILRQQTQKVTKFDADLQKLINDMIDTMRQANGIGLAGPQINQNLSLTVIETLPKVDEEGNDIENSRELYVIINPEISWQSRKIVSGIEGCLSIPGYVGEVDRCESIRVKAQNRTGKIINLRLKGWTARIFQHEIDHLNGILYTDKLTDPSHFWTDEEWEALLEAAKQEEAMETAAL